MAKAKKGLINKYNIEHTDGSPVNPNAKYFVLRYDGEMSDKVFLRANRLAISKFVKEISSHNLNLSQELWDDLANEIMKEAGL